MDYRNPVTTFNLPGGEPEHARNDQVPCGPRFGSIVHVAARPGLEPTAGMATSAVSKAALVYLTRVLDLELRPLGIRVNTVAPALIDNARNRPYLPPGLLAHAVAPGAIVPASRVGRCRERPLTIRPGCVSCRSRAPVTSAQPGAPGQAAVRTAPARSPSPG